MRPIQEKSVIKFYYSYLKQHAGVADLRLREHIEVEWPALVLFGRVVPVERAYAELEGDELLA